ncbi:hypothetical protein ERJ75_000130200 [Trypanosoma vivax]|nr:hypothetical protein TRVL_05033 [Trypanosoma vivax]KAH8619644.1 hypothetical protein ERJ75_000130200 [Trypanosoma vivax]
MGVINAHVGLRQIRPSTLTPSLLRVGHLIASCLSHQRRSRLTVTAQDAPVSFGGCTSCYPWVWNETENWCSLCREPFNSWNEHRGKRDHICLEMFYNALVQYNRRWSPALVWWELEESTMARRRCASMPRVAKTGVPWDGVAPLNGSFVDYVLAPNEGKGALKALMSCYDHAEHLRRRLELHALLQHLIHNGIVRTDRASISGGASFHGSLVMFKELFPNLTNLFPFADAKEISALTQMIASSYNSETVFDLCNFSALLPVGREDEMAEKCAGGDSPRSRTAGEEVGNPNPPESGSRIEHTYHWKGVFCRGVMGQLRWALESDSVACPMASPHVSLARDDKSLYWQIIAEHACRLLLAELTFCRVSEYVVRVEGVWRQRGQETSVRADDLQALSVADIHRQHTSNWGLLKYVNEHLFSGAFGERLPNDGMPKKTVVIK